VHAPHCAIPHPNFVPVRPSTSRNAHSSGMSGGASMFFISPFILRIMCYLGIGNAGKTISLKAEYTLE
jgi:hypothetical protein